MNPIQACSLIPGCYSILRLLLANAVVFAALPVAADEDAAVTNGRRLSFNRDIRPILSENCFFCHGPDAATREADLRLDLRSDALETAIVPGEPDASELISRIFSNDPDMAMPPRHSARSLTDDQKATLRQWIVEGATYESHWSFVTPQRPDLPKIDVANAEAAATREIREAWSKHPVDRFLLQAMDQKNLIPQREADRETLIRRLTFDLTGLPPTLAEIDAFLDDTAPGAYERLVDRLLSSPRFGERMTADWLDVARYSDSYGLQVDRDRRVWPYRDWVINAFNSGMPYDQFIIEQLAGDLLPNATESQILATAFNRLHPQECEGGSVPEEFRTEYVADRTQTVATAFLGLTLECCRCHDHKYDPLSQQEYYQLTSFFDNIDEAGLYSFFTDATPTPTLTLPSEHQRQQLTQRTGAAAEQSQRLAALRSERISTFEAWLWEQRQNLVSQKPAAPSKPQSLTGQIAHLDFEQNPPNGTTQAGGRVGQAIRLGGDDGVQLQVGNFPRWQPFSVSLWMQVADHKERAVVFHRSRAWTDAASRGYELLLIDGHLQASLIHFWPGNAVSIRSQTPLPLNRWVHVVMSWDGSSSASGLGLSIDGVAADIEIVRDHLTKNITGGGGDEIMIGARFRDRGLTGGLVDEFRVFDRQLTQLEVAELFSPGRIDDLLRREVLSDVEQQQLLDYYLSVHDAEYQAQLNRVREARQHAFALADSFDEIMVMREMSEPRQTYLLARGAYDAPTLPVESATPAALLPFDPALPNNRLGLAQWLVDPAHPLTARVAVNRLWQTMFGRGLVATPEDFGNQGSPPSHPELLDWLAVEFIDSGWDTKRLIRQVVTSAAYRQSSAEADPRDPENVYLSRSPRYRWPAEMLRDNVLLTSGLLCESIGGPPARPYEVENSFKPVARDRGRGSHRRSLYTYWNRTGPAPALTTLDAALRDVCRMKREVTATPLQSLVVLNSPQFAEAARELAQRLTRQHGDDINATLQDLFRILTSRQGTIAELDVIRQLHQKQRDRFEQHPEMADQWLSVGDAPRDQALDRALVAATASVANTLFNYDGCVTKR